MFLIPSFSEYINENVYIPRIKLKDEKIFNDLVQGKFITYNEKFFIRAIEYGMILTITYKGAKDTSSNGHIRTIYPMVIGESNKGTPLLRAWHLKGFSVSKGGETDKIWRLFRTDRILNFKFDGLFYRSSPDGYKSEDSAFKKITKSANINEIIRNQDELMKTKKIQDVKDINISLKKEVKLQTTNTTLNLTNPYSNAYLEQNKNNKSAINITILEGITTKKIYPLFGTVGKDGDEISLKDTNNNLIEKATILFNVNGNNISKLKKIKGNTEFDLYIAIL